MMQEQDEKLFRKRYGGYFLIVVSFLILGVFSSLMFYEVGVMFFLFILGFLLLGLILGKLWVQRI